ncbi:MAG TPA: tRNA (N(6)-L-threonylcarbamoyladenosine(37)-C(2))-methylthiotransferase MtaB [Planctomycetes bacterium]|nr:tRNA (N(6)-L-threonylcarbamoyladenosine(37)-C(2))-methylthiotransferase MtaB [Planctomycetota bacterium]
MTMPGTGTAEFDLDDQRAERAPRPLRSVRSFRVGEVGCKVNQWEGQWLREGLVALGLEESSEQELADLFVVNSCSVTGSGGSKSRHMIRRLVRQNPGARVIVTGCYAVSDEEVCRNLPGVVAVFGNEDKDAIVPWVAREILGMDGPLPDLPRGISRFQGHTRAFVKIQDGCRDHCTFCIIPSLRGAIRSRSQEDLLEELRRLVACGYKEVVFTGVHLGYFGWDLDEDDALIRLLRAARTVDGLERVKLSSIEVHEITEELVQLFAEDPFYLPHFHLPLQAGCDRTLRRMRRKYSTERFRSAVRRLRAAIPDPCITTDVIVGFPGETDEDFDASFAFCREMSFAKMHIFPYSVREGTPAAEYAGKVAPEAIKDRKGRLAALDDVMADHYRRAHLDRVAPTLIEDRPGHSGSLTGLTDRFLRVDLDGPDALRGRIVPVRLEAVEGDRLRGRLATGEAAS